MTFRVMLLSERDAGYKPVEADSPKEAAEKKVGSPLREQGAMGDLRAMVRLPAPSRGMSAPILYYAQAGSGV